MRLIIYNVSRLVFANDDGGGFFYKTLEPPSSTYRGVKCTGQSINAQSALCTAKFSAISIMQCNVQCITECIGQSINAQYAPASLCAPILVSLRTLIMYPQKIPLIVYSAQKIPLGVFCSLITRISNSLIMVKTSPKNL